MRNCVARRRGGKGRGSSFCKTEKSSRLERIVDGTNAQAVKAEKGREEISIQR